MKLDVCVCEALGYTNGTIETGFVGVATNYHQYLIYENILSKAEQKRTFTRYQTCYTNSTEGSVYMEVSGRTSSLLQYSCMMPKTIDIG